MNLSKKQCDEFMRNPRKNPLTGRIIQIGKVTHTKLKKACGQTLDPNRKAPPMGPIMHWRIGAKNENDRLRNLIKMANFIEEELDKMETKNIISEMQIVEFKDFLKFMSKVFANDEAYEKYIEFFQMLLKRIKELEESKIMLDDWPRYTVIEANPVYPQRFKTREEVLAIWGIYTSTLETIEDAIVTGKVFFAVPKGTIKDLLKDKKYLDYLIEHKVFSYDDIYKRVFKSEKVFDELAMKYKKYREIYKKVKGRSP